MKPQIKNGVLARADRAEMLAALREFSGKSAVDWLPSPHPAYLGQLPAGGWGAVKRLTAKQIVQAVAAAAPNHCIDGWSYASRALAALLAGDMHAARHLAYYAQLRAGLSILANVGVGVFNGVNFVICADGTIERLDESYYDGSLGPGLGTHDAVWAAVQEWVTGAATSRVFLDLVKVRGVSLRECMVAIWPGFSPVAAATTLITAWGVDLKRGKDEHRYRNISSYSLQSLNPLKTTMSDSISFLKSFWALFEPTGVSNFDNIDKYTLRSMMLKQHRIMTNQEDYANGEISRRYDELPAAVKRLVPRDFLVRAKMPRGPELLQRANSTISPAKPTDMLGRAFMLLRVATAFTHTSFVDAGIDCSGDDLRPWIDEWAASRGFSTPALPLDDPMSLYDDIQIALEDFEASVNPEPPTLGVWLQSNATGMPILSQAERVAVWNLRG